MQLDFNTDIVKENTIKLLDCQVNLILRSLEFYSYTYKFIYPRIGKAATEEEEKRISLVTDTYEQILNQYVNSEIKKEKNKKDFKKIS